MERPSRRDVLRGAGAAVTILVAGCGGDGGTTTPTSEGTTTEMPTSGGTSTETPTTPESLAIEHVRFVTDRPRGYRQYTRTEDTTFGADETIWLYFEPTGVASERAGESTVRFSVVTTLTILGPDGGEVDTLSEEVTRTIDAKRDLSELFLFWQFDLPSGVPAGEYTARITVTDTLTDRSSTRTTLFTITETVTATESEYRTQFRRAIVSELDVDIQSLTVAGGTVDLVYETPASINSTAASQQIGYVAGAYAGVVDAGWETDRLRVTFVTAEGGRYRFRVEASVARDWIDGRISRDEFVDAVFETLTEAETDGA